MLRQTVFSLVTVLTLAGAARAELPPEAARKLYEEVTPSLVAVRYTWESELGRRELTGAGVVVGAEGVVVAPLNVFDMRIPDGQMKEFKILVPSQTQDAAEVEATLLGRDERTNLAFLKTAEPQKWKAITFEDLSPGIGETVASVGLLPEAAAFKTYFTQGTISAHLRGEIPQVLVQGGLGSVGSPVFNSAGKAIGLVAFQTNQTTFLNDAANALQAIENPPKFYVPAADFLPSLRDPPQGKEVVLPWIGVPQLTGLNKDVAEVFNLTNQPAIQVGEVIEGTPAAAAGLKQGDIIVKMNGQPLERGDEPEELPMIFRRKLMRMKVGDTVTFSVLSKRDEPLKDVSVKLEEMPRRAHQAKRWFAEDLGFSAREVIYFDAYVRKLSPKDAKGAVVALVRPQSAAQSAGLQVNDLITDLNGQPVSDLEGFRKAYEEFRKGKPREAVVIVVLRESNTQTIRIEPPQ